MVYEIMNENHLPQIAKMYVEAFNAPPWNDKWTIDTATRRLLQMMRCDGFLGLIYSENNKVCGMILGNHEVYYDCMHFNIKEFFVGLEVRDKGIGSMLLNELEKRLKENGINEIYLFTSKTDTTEGFYQKRGFESWKGMVMMSKQL